jgi:3-hydroxymyristoyl/3-hydroxydecanoyl-(acyl carrier protein) dehydratase
VYNLNDIVRINPQRYPISLVDQVLENQKSTFSKGIKAVTSTDFCYRLPSLTSFQYPKSLLIESFLQAAGVAVDTNEIGISGTPLFSSLSQVSFESNVYPGDIVVHHVSIANILVDNKAIVVKGYSTCSKNTVMKVSSAIVAIVDSDHENLA